MKTKEFWALVATAAATTIVVIAMVYCIMAVMWEV